MAAEKDHGACNNSRCNLLARPTRCRADSLEEIVARSFLLRDSAEDALDSLTERGYVAASRKRLLSQKAAATFSRGFLFSWTNSKSSNLAAYCRTLQSCVACS